ncbi:MAG: hypothetical protein IJ458_03165 [Clostridia bacterium]|nr:hypothetical protein [Clostridia bacterium]
MTSLIKGMLKKFKYVEMPNEKNDWKQWSDVELGKAEYTLHYVRVCKLARISHKKKKRITAEDLERRIVKKGVLMISVGGEWYMDIETGKHYELGKLFGEELQNPNNELYVVSENPLYYECYDTIKGLNLQPNDQFTARQLRNLYINHFDTKVKQLFEGNS